MTRRTLDGNDGQITRYEDSHGAGLRVDGRSVFRLFRSRDAGLPPFYVPVSVLVLASFFVAPAAQRAANSFGVWYSRLSLNSHYHSNRKRTGTVTREATARLPRRAGSNSQRRTAWTAASSRAGTPELCATVASSTRPVALTPTRTRTTPSWSCRRAPSGYAGRGLLRGRARTKGSSRGGSSLGGRGSSFGGGGGCRGSSRGVGGADRVDPPPGPGAGGEAGLPRPAPPAPPLDSPALGGAEPAAPWEPLPASPGLFGSGIGGAAGAKSVENPPAEAGGIGGGGVAGRAVRGRTATCGAGAARGAKFGAGVRRGGGTRRAGGPERRGGRVGAARRARRGAAERGRGGTAAGGAFADRGAARSATTGRGASSTSISRTFCGRALPAGVSRGRASASAPWASSEAARKNSREPRRSRISGAAYSSQATPSRNERFSAGWKWMSSTPSCGSPGRREA